MTTRGAKKTFFYGLTDKTSKLGVVSPSGICALTVIADKEEMKEASTETEDVSEGVWKNEVVVRPKENEDM